MGEMEYHCCSTCKKWEPLKNESTGICTRGDVHGLLNDPGITPPDFGCVYHSDSFCMMEKKIADITGLKELIIDAIIGGVHIPTGGLSKTLTPFTGNQWNEDWGWNRNELEKMDYNALTELYETKRHVAQIKIVN
jgi:hypothetical protein